MVSHLKSEEPSEPPLSPVASKYFLPQSFWIKQGTSLETDAQFLSSMYDRESFRLYFEGRGKYMWNPGATLKFTALQDIMAFDIWSDPTRFINRSLAWHSILCKILTENFYALTFTTMQLPLIPLRGGSWVSPRLQDKIYFGFCTNGQKIPDGLGLNLIDNAAGFDLDRAGFYVLAGCQWASPNQVSKIILEKHKELVKSGTQDFDTRLLLEHAVFLFHCRDELEDRIRFNNLLVECFSPGAPSQRDIKPASQVLLHRTNIFDPGKYFSNASGDLFLLAESWDRHHYLTIFNSGWEPWLKDIGIQSHPPILQAGISEPELSYHFELLLAKDPQSLTRLLLDNVFVYEASLSTLKADCPRAYKSLREMRILCNDLRSRPLSECYRPKRRYTNLLGDGYPIFTSFFPKIAAPHISKWAALEHIGLRNGLDIDFYIKCLRALKDSKSCTEKMVTRIYRLLSICERTEENLIVLRRLFDDERLVAAYRDSADRQLNVQPTWLKSSEVVWWSGKACRPFPMINYQDPEIERFFTQALQLKKPSISGFIEVITGRLAQDSPLSGWDYSLLEDLNNHLTQNNSSLGIEQLMSVSMFKSQIPEPLGDGIGPRVKEEWLPLSKEWYIPDNRTMLKTFQGRLPLCDPDPRQVKLAETLINRLHLNNRHLSRMAESECETKGPVFETLTHIIVSKASLILRLFPKHEFDVAIRIIKQLQLSRCHKIMNKPYVHTGGGIVWGLEGDTDICSRWTKDGSLEIFVSTEELFGKAVESNTIPFWKIGDLLAEEMEIEGDVERSLMRHIMSTSAEDKLESLLDENGIRTLTNEEAAQVYSWTPTTKASLAIEALESKGMSMALPKTTVADSHQPIVTRKIVTSPPKEAVGDVSVSDAHCPVVPSSLDTAQHVVKAEGAQLPGSNQVKKEVVIKVEETGISVA